MTKAATGLAPFVESRATEEQLAASAVLLGGDRPRSREPPKRVPMQTQVLRRVSRVKPLVSPIDVVVLEASNDCRRHSINETVDQHVDHQAVVVARVTQPASSLSEHQPCRIRRFGLRPLLPTWSS